MKENHLPLIQDSKDQKRFSNIEDALDYFDPVEYTNYPVSPGDCFLDEEGFFSVASEKVKLTDLSYRTLLELLNIPYEFAFKTCPVELGVHIVNRMLNERKGKKVSCWINTGSNTLEAVTSPEFSPIRHHTFLNAFADALDPKDEIQIHLSSAQLRIVKLFELKLDPKPGDFFQFGTEFINFDIFSENKYLQADAFLLRLVCSNGSKMKSILRRFSDIFKPPITETALRDSIKKISFSEEDKMMVSNAFKWMGEREIGIHRDRIFNRFRIMAKKYIPLPGENPFTAENTYYDIFNHITQAAQNKNIPFPRRREIEGWAGSLPDAYTDAKKSGKSAAFWEGAQISI